MRLFSATSFYACLGRRFAFAFTHMFVFRGQTNFCKFQCLLRLLSVPQTLIRHSWRKAPKVIRQSLSRSTLLCCVLFYITLLGQHVNTSFAHCSNAKWELRWRRYRIASMARGRELEFFYVNIGIKKRACIKRNKFALASSLRACGQHVIQLDKNETRTNKSTRNLRNSQQQRQRPRMAYLAMYKHAMPPREL